MRIEQYFLMTDYSLWEVILNARKNELKARGTLLMALPDKHQLKFNSHKDAKTLMEDIEKRFKGNTETKKRNMTDLEEHSLDDLFNSLKLYEAEVKGSSSASTTIQNLAFVSSSNTDNNNEPVSAAASISVVSAKILVSSLPNVDSLSNAVIYSFFASQSSSPQLDNDDLKQINADDLEEMDLKCFQAEEESTNYAFMAFSSSSSFSDNERRDNALVSLRQNLEKAEQERDDLKLKLEIFQTSFKNLTELLASQTNAKTGLGYNSQVFTRAMFDCDDYLSSGSDESLPPSLIYDRSSVQHVETSILHVTLKTAIPKSTSNGKRMNRKACFVCKSLDHLIKDCDYHEKKMALPTARNHAYRENHKQYAQIPLANPQRHMVHAAVLTQSKPVPITTVRPTDVPKISVTRLRQATSVVTKSKSPPRRHINHSQSPKASNSPPRVTSVKAPLGNLQHALKDKGVIDSRSSRHMIGNMSYLSNFKELNGGYVAFGGNPNGDKVSRKGKIETGKLDFDDVYFVKELKFNLFSVSRMCDKKNSVLFTDTECLVLSLEFKLFDENQVLLRVPRENNMYNVNLKNIVPFGDLTCHFTKATIDESNLWHRRLGHINFKTMNKLVKENKEEFSVPRTPQQNGIVKRKNRTLIEAARTMLADSLLPIPFWAEAVNTTCYVQNRVLVTKPHNKTPYELLDGKTPSIGFMRHFGCPVTILNTLDSLGKFNGKVDEGFLVGYSVSISGPTWLFDINTLTKTMNYQPVTAGNQSNPSAGVQEQFNAEKAGEDSDQQYVLFLVWSSGSTNPQNTDGDAVFDEKKPEFEGRKPEPEVIVSSSSSVQSKKHDGKTKREAKGKSHVESLTGYKNLSVDTNTFSAAGPSNAAASPTHGKSSRIDTAQYPDDPDMPELEDITYYDDDDNVGAETDFNNLETSITVSPIPTTRVHKDHHINSDDFHTCMFACFFSQEEPKRVHQALKDPSYIEAMQKDLLQFKMQKVWVLVDLPHGKRAIGTKWVFRNKKDERSIVVRNKARLVTQGHTHKDGIDYEEVFAPVARIESIRLFLAYASFMGFMVYQMDVKSTFVYRTIEEEIYVCQPLGFEDLDHPDKVKERQEKDKIRSKPDKNGKRGEAEKSQNQLQSIKKEKLKKVQVEGPKMQSPTKSSLKLSRDQTSNPTSSTNPTLKGRIRRSSKQKVKNSNFEENPIPFVPMAEKQMNGSNFGAVAGEAN
nr:hypothetical protein [Tanacetum cinerariifolium]